VAGPIVRYRDIEEKLTERSHSLDGISDGIRRFVLGMGKKVLLSNNLGALCSIFQSSNDKSVGFFWLYAISYTLQIYFDFSGYSDMAIGLGKMFGFDFCENFNFPYISKSITEFWRRWHISLGSWFRDYVYIPMGGNRVKKWRWFFNILTVWLLTGLWHGASWNFVIWGLYFGIFLIIEKLFLLEKLKKSKILSHIYVIIIIIFGFVIFNAETMSEAMMYMKAMVGLGGYKAVSAEFIYYLKSYAVILIISTVTSTPFVKNIIEKLRKKKGMDSFINLMEPVVLLVITVVSVGYLVDNSFNPFLYFRF
jgi:alginate O-acetyltransferase complex protein AlgI